MIKKKRKKYRIDYKRFFSVIMIFAIIGFGINYGIGLFKNVENDVMKLSFEMIPIVSKHRGVVLRHETVNNSLNTGTFSASIEQAERVKNVQLIGTLSVSAFNQQETKNNSINQYLIDEKNLDDEVNRVYGTLLGSLKTKDLVSASFLKEELESKLLRMKKMKIENSQNAFELKENQNKNVGDSNAQIGENINIYSNESGVVSFFIDGLEADVNYNNRYKIDYEKLWNSEIIPNDTRGKSINKGESLFKIIKPSVWYIACEIPREELDLYKAQSNVFIEAEGKKVEASIYEVFDENDSGVLILKINNQLSMLFNSRIVDITLIRSEVRGVAIPKSAIIKRNNTLGVYVINIDNKLKFVQIEILEDDGERFVVQEGTIRRKNVNDEIEIIQTVRNGDDIVRHAQNHKEGEFIENVRR